MKKPSGCPECARSRQIITARNAQIAKLNSDLDDAYVAIGRLKAELRCKEARMKHQTDDLARRQHGRMRKRDDNDRNGRSADASSIANRLFAGQSIPAEEVPASIHEDRRHFIFDQETYTVRATHVVGRQNLGRLLRAAFKNGRVDQRIDHPASNRESEGSNPSAPATPPEGE